MICSRFAFMFTMPYVVRALIAGPRSGSGEWARACGSCRPGRGCAARRRSALALPLETDAGAPLPERDLILFITFVLILVTVVGQGLSLLYLIRRLGVREDGAEEAAEERMW